MKLNYVLLSLAVILTIACDDEKFIGGTIRPAKDEINILYVDTIPIKAFSYQPGNFRTDRGVKGNDYFLLGGFQPQDLDEVTSIKGDVVFEFWTDTFRLPAAGEVIDPRDTTGNTKISGVRVVDSVFLSIVQSGYFGDTMAVNYFEVYELNTRLSHTQDYYDNEDPLNYYSPEDLIGVYNAQTKYTYDTLEISTSSGLIPYRVIQIPLDKKIAERFINNQEQATSTEGFRDLFKGVYVKTLSGEGAMWSIYPEFNNLYTSLAVQYHFEAEVGDTVLTDNIYYNEAAIVNNECAGFNVLRKTEGTYDFSIDENSPQPEELYIQGLGVSNIRLKIPSIYDNPLFGALPGEDSARIAFNSAKIIFQVDSVKQEESLNWAPGRINLRRDTAGGFIFTPGQLLYVNSSQEANYFYGLRTTSYTYEYDISEYIQELFNLKTVTPDDLVLSVNNNRRNPSAAILKGLGSDEPPKLKIIYTRY